MCRMLQAVLGLVTLAMPTGAMAQSPAPPRFVLACAPCHGFDGLGHDSSIPNLAGQHREYLYRQLLAFRGGQRVHPTMNFFSAQMTRDELEQIVDYYAGLPAFTPHWRFFKGVHSEAERFAPRFVQRKGLNIFDTSTTAITVETGLYNSRSRPETVLLRART
jgi:cytochrome c553